MSSAASIPVSPPVSPYGPVRLARRPTRRRSPISLTALIDVVFILLVFFMLATSLADWRMIRLDMPVGVEGRADAGAAVTVEVRPEGLRLAGVPVTPDSLQRLLRSRMAPDPARRVLVLPAQGATLQQAVAAIDLMSAAGVRDVSLVRDALR